MFDRQKYGNVFSMRLTDDEQRTLQRLAEQRNAKIVDVVRDALGRYVQNETTATGVHDEQQRS
jgi:predicted transcriptional regulator